MDTLNIRIPHALAGRLQHLADETGRTKSYYVRAALEEKIQELEDYHIAMQALENVETGKSRTWTHEEIEKGNDKK